MTIIYKRFEEQERGECKERSLGFKAHKSCRCARARTFRS